MEATNKKYIEVNTFKSIAEERMYERTISQFITPEACFAFHDGANYIIEDVLEDVPASDVAEVKHGKWLHFPDYGVTRCPYCDWSIEECWDTNHCPNCGTKMDLK